MNHPSEKCEFCQFATAENTITKAEREGNFNGLQQAAGVKNLCNCIYRFHLDSQKNKKKSGEASCTYVILWIWVPSWRNVYMKFYTLFLTCARVVNPVIRNYRMERAMTSLLRVRLTNVNTRLECFQFINCRNDLIRGVKLKNSRKQRGSHSMWGILWDSKIFFTRLVVARRRHQFSS